MANLTREMKDISFNNSFGFRPMPGTCEKCAFGRGVHSASCIDDQARRIASNPVVQIHEAVSAFDPNAPKALGATPPDSRTTSTSSRLTGEMITWRTPERFR